MRSARELGRLAEFLSPSIPILQAPMAGVGTPLLAAAVSNAGGLGGIAVGAMSPMQAKEALAELRSLTERAFNVNLFVHNEPVRDPAGIEARWLSRLSPLFQRYNSKSPTTMSPR